MGKCAEIYARIAAFDMGNAAVFKGAAVECAAIQLTLGNGAVNKAAVGKCAVLEDLAFKAAAGDGLVFL